MTEIWPNLKVIDEEDESLLGSFDDVKAQLKRKFITHYPTVIRRTTMKEDCGHTSTKNKKIYILINKNLCEEAQILVLAHEYAHALAWRGEDQENEVTSDHNPEFGLAYARVWGALFDD